MFHPGSSVILDASRYAATSPSRPPVRAAITHSVGARAAEQPEHGREHHRERLPRRSAADEEAQVRVEHLLAPHDPRPRVVARDRRQRRRPRSPPAPRRRPSRPGTGARGPRRGTGAPAPRPERRRRTSTHGESRQRTSVPITRNPSTRRQLLALLVGARAIVHGNLEDPLAALHQPGGDLGLDRKAGRAQRKAAEHVCPDHLVAGHDVVQVHVEEDVARERDALVPEHEQERVAGVPVECPHSEARVRAAVEQRRHQQREVARGRTRGRRRRSPRIRHWPGRARSARRRPCRGSRDARTGARARPSFRSRSSSRVPSVEPSSTTTSSNSTGSSVSRTSAIARSTRSRSL